MTVTKGVVLRQCSISEHGGETTIRGLIDVGSYAEGLILEGSYQREALPVSSVEDWVEALRKGDVPDIDLGMRGSDFDSIGDHGILLKNPVYVIDGLQRITAVRAVLADEDNRIKPHLWAVLRFNTTEESERARFLVLNMKRRKLSGNKIAANLRHDYPIAQALYDLTVPADEEVAVAGSSFVLMGRVTWTQRAKKGDLLSATTLLKVLGELHAHRGSTKYSNIEPLMRGLQEVADDLTVERLVANLTYMFNFADEAWRIGNIQYRDRSAGNSQSFLTGLARVFSIHTNFWRGEELVIKQSERPKLLDYPVNDPSVINMIGVGSAGRDSIVRDLIAHINRGRRTGHLVERQV